MKLQGISLLLCCVYMPCDTMYDIHNDEMYNMVFNDIVNSNICNDVDHIVIGGDLNTDMSRVRSLHTKSLLHICERENMICVPIQCAANGSESDIYTYESKSNGSRSCIDHFIVSDGLSNSIERCFVSHDGDNLSDHSFVTLSLALNVEYDIIDVGRVNYYGIEPQMLKFTDIETIWTGYCQKFN